MRDFTKEEMKHFETVGTCLFCGGKAFYEGPSGGMCTNIYCSNEECGAGYNVNYAGMTYQVIRFPDGGDHPQIEVQIVPGPAEQLNLGELGAGRPHRLRRLATQLRTTFGARLVRAGRRLGA